jgi:hypothetical protein
MVALANSEQMHFFKNWLSWVRQTGISYFLVAAADTATLDALPQMAAPCFAWLVDFRKEVGGLGNPCVPAHACNVCPHKCGEWCGHRPDACSGTHGVHGHGSTTTMGQRPPTNACVLPTLPGSPFPG